AVRETDPYERSLLVHVLDRAGGTVFAPGRRLFLGVLVPDEPGLRDRERRVIHATFLVAHDDERHLDAVVLVTNATLHPDVAAVVVTVALRVLAVEIGAGHAGDHSTDDDPSRFSRHVCPAPPIGPRSLI